MLQYFLCCLIQQPRISSEINNVLSYHIDSKNQRYMMIEYVYCCFLNNYNSVYLYKVKRSESKVRTRISLQNKNCLVVQKSASVAWISYSILVVRGSKYVTVSKFYVIV